MKALWLVLLILPACFPLGAEGNIKVNKGGEYYHAPKPDTFPGKHHCDIGSEIECCCIKDATGKINNCTCVEK